MLNARSFASLHQLDRDGDCPGAHCLKVTVRAKTFIDRNATAGRGAARETADDTFSSAAVHTHEHGEGLRKPHMPNVWQNPKHGMALLLPSR